MLWRRSSILMFPSSPAEEESKLPSIPPLCGEPGILGASEGDSTNCQHKSQTNILSDMCCTVLVLKPWQKSAK